MNSSHCTTHLVLEACKVSIVSVFHLTFMVDNREEVVFVHGIRTRISTESAASAVEVCGADVNTYVGSLSFPCSFAARVV